MNETGQKNLNCLCLARKMVILKCLKNFTKFVSGTPTVFALKRMFLSLLHCRKQIRGKIADIGKKS